MAKEGRVTPFRDIRVKFGEWDCYVALDLYVKGNRLCINLYGVDDDELVTTATTNVPEAHQNEDVIFVKDYSENEGMVKALEDARIVKFSGKRLQPINAFVEIPVCQITNEAILLWYKREKEEADRHAEN